MDQDFVITASPGGRDRYSVQITTYHYYLLDSQGREIVAYHWHPGGVSPVTVPHMHLSSRIGRLDVGPGFDPAALGEMHLPTGFVTLADLVRLLITEFGIAPRRADWETILQGETTQLGDVSRG